MGVQSANATSMRGKRLINWTYKQSYKL